MTAQPQRPRRQRKGDRILTPGATRTEIECDYAIAPLDRAALDMDRKWGIDRLPEIVSPEMAQRYGAAMAYLNACLEEGDPDNCAAAAGNCIRGLHAMDAEATRLGRQTASGDYLEYEMDGFKFGVLKDKAEWRTAQDARPDLHFYSLREVAVALQAVKLDNPMFREIKDALPKAEVIAIRPKTPGEKFLEDEIPF